jgi:malate dehydrogenase (oxaloacetate-decarboxylating)(NADP+)
MRAIGNKARRNPKRIVFAEAENIKVLKSAQIVFDDGIGYPILLGDENKIRSIADANSIDVDEFPIFDPRSDIMEEKRNQYAELFFAKRGRKGFNEYDSKKIMKDRNYFGCMMVECGDADAMISGLSKNYPDTIRPAIQVIGMEEGVKKIAGMYMMLTKKGPLFLADTTVNFSPTAEELAEITLLAAREVRHFNIIPRIAMLSYSTFGSSNSPEARLVAEARSIVKERMPSLLVDGEMQANVVFNKEIIKENYPFSELADQDVNTLIFPNLSAGNIAYNLMKELDFADAVGPILLGMKKPVHILQLGSSVRSIINMALIAVLDAQVKSKSPTEEIVKNSGFWKSIRK